ncbi:hypothetical protein ABZX93_06570 [Streptomyces sp. NPDC006632]|uniref:hypothetical protein n=1 Tax=Streptomyces sp. NPDC006632 TaxID=3157182 RepID=UPI0033BE8F11
MERPRVERPRVERLRVERLWVERLWVERLWVEPTEAVGSGRAHVTAEVPEGRESYFYAPLN